MKLKIYIALLLCSLVVQAPFPEREVAVRESDLSWRAEEKNIYTMFKYMPDESQPETSILKIVSNGKVFFNVFVDGEDVTDGEPIKYFVEAYDLFERKRLSRVTNNSFSGTSQGKATVRTRAQSDSGLRGLVAGVLARIHTK